MTEEEKKHQKELWKQDRIRQRHEEWEKIKGLGFGARLQYLWDYYKIVLAIAAAAALVVYLIVTMIQGSRTETLLYVCVLNADELDPDTEHLQEDYIKARGGLEKMQNMVFDASIYVNPDATGTSQQDVAAAIKITSYVGAKSLDAFLAPFNVTEYEQEGGMLLALDEILTQEEIDALGEAGCLYYAKESDQEHIFAVRIDQAGVIGNYDIYGEEQVWFSMIGNSTRIEETARLLHFLLGEEVS